MKKSQLKGMKMPMAKKPEEDMMLELDAMPEHDEGSAEEESMEDPSEEAAEGDMQDSPELPKLDAISDDDLLAEVRKRGLMKDLESGEDDMMESDNA